MKEEEWEGDEPLDVTDKLAFDVSLNMRKVLYHHHTQIWRVEPTSLNSTCTGVEPRSEAIEKYDRLIVVKTTTAI